ncbi:threonine aldolase family protein [Elioraea thermophila]|uniref:threonine aldolase family protein n=1 Tax=Elioraea thermophila TaxID=2185104 RepID=UPI000DF491F4|nr:threonine aldolase family protein [Elioraea thermophila]
MTNTVSYIPPRPDPRLPPPRINLFSDTQTKPTPAMREAMARAEVGDEQFGDDPTVWALCDRMCALLGTEAAVFLPSGTMANQIAIRVHCRPGDEILAHETAHIVTSEHGGPWANAGAAVRGLPGERGIFSAETLRAAIRPKSRYAPPQSLVSVEQTANIAGGTVWRAEELAAVVEVARAAGLATHMDGARLMNAAVALGVPAAALARGFDSVWLDFSKGLGAPVGAVLCGSRAFIDEAWRWKQRMGGAMRQAGVIAAACLHALDHHVARLAEDHANARLFADRLAAIEGVTVQPPETNLVFFDPSGAGLSPEALAARLAQRGIRISVLGGRCRAATHLDVTAAMVEEAAAEIRAILGG